MIELKLNKEQFSKWDQPLFIDNELIITYDDSQDVIIAVVVQGTTLVKKKIMFEGSTFKAPSTLSDITDIYNMYLYIYHLYSLSENNEFDYILEILKRRISKYNKNIKHAEMLSIL